MNIPGLFLLITGIGTIMTKLPDKELLRPDEVAAYYSVTIRTVRNWISLGKLDAVRIAGRTLRIPREAVLSLEEPIE